MGRIVVGLYDEFSDAKKVIRDLIKNNFHREKISLVASDYTGEFSKVLEESEAAIATGASSSAGSVIAGQVSELVGLGMNLTTLEAHGFGPVLAAGPLEGALQNNGARAEIGGFTGALTLMGIPKEDAQNYVEGVRQGGSLVAVKTLDGDSRKALEIMNRYHPVDIDQRSAEWHSHTRTGYDQTGEPRPVREPRRTRQQVDEEDEGNGFPPEALDRERFHYANRVGNPQNGVPDETLNRREAVEGGPSVPADPNSLAVDQPIGEASESYGETHDSGHQILGFDENEPEIRHHFETTYSDLGYDWEEIRPAYMYGWELGLNDRYTKQDWGHIEADARRQWQKDHPEEDWYTVRDAIMQGWSIVRLQGS